LGRPPTGAELKLAESCRPACSTAGVEDLLWAITMLPDFQLIY